MKKKTYKAVIIQPGDDEREPSIRLEDGREFPAGWNMGQTFPVGTEGTAQYVSTSTIGLWQFTPTKA